MLNLNGFIPSLPKHQYTEKSFFLKYNIITLLKFILIHVITSQLVKCWPLTLGLIYTYALICIYVCVYRHTQIYIYMWYIKHFKILGSEKGLYSFNKKITFNLWSKLNQNKWYRQFMKCIMFRILLLKYLNLSFAVYSRVFQICFIWCLLAWYFILFINLLST